ncbi:MAG TPA: Ku protein [Dehalococcoidales bacterium]|nr:Ku protein [Dehalococcoidales bacterium]
MARAFWKGVISFGMVAIPVRMSLATSRKSINFHLLHKKCHNRAKQVLYCPEDNEYFSIKETVRGYEYSKDQFIILDDKDFEKVPISTSHSINIHSFVDAKEIDPLLYGDSHYLEPDELGAKPFALLKETLIKTGRVGIAKVSFQRREHLVCLRPEGDIILLSTLHYNNEVLPPPEPAKASYTQQELEMAMALVKVMVKPFKPEEYHDDYEQALDKVIQAKLKGEKIVAPKPLKVETGDIMAALRASINAAKKEPVTAR